MPWTQSLTCEAQTSPKQSPCLLCCHSDGIVDPEWSWGPSALQSCCGLAWYLMAGTHMLTTQWMWFNPLLIFAHTVNTSSFLGLQTENMLMSFWSSHNDSWLWDVCVDLHTVLQQGPKLLHSTVHFDLVELPQFDLREHVLPHHTTDGLKHNKSNTRYTNASLKRVRCCWEKVPLTIWWTDPAQFICIDMRFIITWFILRNSTNPLLGQHFCEPLK